MAEELSILGESLSVTGRITGEGDLEIRGRVEGAVVVRGEVVLAETSVVKATVVGARVSIRGALLGDVLATELIVLESAARVVGNLKAPRIAIALGAQVRGQVDMGEVMPGERPAAKAAAKAVAKPSAPPATVPVARPVARSAAATVLARPASAPFPMAPRPAPAVGSSPASAVPQPARTPPEPVVPAIKKGARASKKRA